MTAEGAREDSIAALHAIIQHVVRRTLFPQLLPSANAHPARPSTAPARHPSAKDRRQSIARCRTLRQEITSFENSFTQSHGHVPKGAERFPHQAVYEEYRSLKVRIRDDAATHIQAVFRGFRCRKTWKVRHQPGRTNQPRPERRSEPAGISAELAALRDEKASLKRSLRAFDVQFAAAHGRPPSKAEKEHLRPQYTRYHELKQIITRLEEANGIKAPDEADDDAPDRQASSGRAAAVPAAEAVIAHDDENRSRRSDSFASVAGIDGDGDDDSRPSSRASSGRPGSAAGADGGTAALRAEKKKLQAFLRDYEKSFQERWGRPVKLVKDIAPVMDKYQRYKQLKQLLADGGK